jgi:hypothetical protein
MSMAHRCNYDDSGMKDTEKNLAIISHHKSNYIFLLSCLRILIVMYVLFCLFCFVVWVLCTVCV